VDRHDKVGLGKLVKYHSPENFAFPVRDIGVVVTDDLGAAQVRVLVEGRYIWWNKEDLEYV
jgi:hypothetical protein